MEKNLKIEFNKIFKWNILASIFYELAKMAHQFFSLKILSSQIYGLKGSIFSIIYLTIYLSNFGWNDSIAPFLEYFIISKQNFKKIFLKIFFLPQILLTIIISLSVTFFYKNSFLNSPGAPYIALIPIIIIIESIRLFLRRFLHIVFKSPSVIKLETPLMIIYFSFIWIPYIIFNRPITLNIIFSYHALDSFFALMGFFIILYNFYKNLPNQPYKHEPNLIFRILKNRFFNYSLSAGKNFFTGNFLTPFFAKLYGFEYAGLIHMANHISESIKSILKSTLLFSGNALFAKIKNYSLSEKKEAFKILSSKINLILYPIIIFLILNYNNIKKLQLAYKVSGIVTTIAMLFFVMTLLEYLFILYEQFYMIEEYSGKLFLYKIIEFILLYIYISYGNFSSLVSSVIGIFLIRFFSFLIIAIGAYNYWGIIPTFKIRLKKSPH